MNDISYMRRALALARRGGALVRPNPMVGAILVQGGKIVGKGWHRQYGEPHAEVEAIKDAGGSARGATLYVTLEPCNHQGKTPPCTEAVINAGITRAVVAMKDPNPQVAGGGNEALMKAGIELSCGCLEKEAQELNASWIHRITTGRPMYYGLCVLGVNGIAASDSVLDAEPRLSRWKPMFDAGQMVLVRDRRRLEESLKRGEISRLVVVHLPELAAGHGSPLPFPGARSLTLLRSRRAGKLALSVYEL
jgi:pyrimidine deaminase RibD-like protein